MVWFILLSLRSSTMQFFCPTIRINVFATFLGLIPMVANYRSSDAVFAEGLNNKEDVNDKVNKRVDGRIMDPFKEVLNLL